MLAPPARIRARLPWPVPRRWHRLLKSIDRYMPPVDPVGTGRGHEDNHVRDLFRRAQPSHGEALAHIGGIRFGMSLAKIVPVAAGPDDRAGRDDVNANIVARKLPNESISIDGALLPFVKSITATIITWYGCAP